MNSMLKKSLLAAAVAATCSANAATIDVTDISAAMGVQPPRVSSEGLAIAGTINVGLAADQIDVIVTPEIQSYDSNDILVFTVSGATIRTTGSGATALSSVRLYDTSGTANVLVAQGLNVNGSSVSLGLVDTDTVTAGFQNPLLTAATGTTLQLSGVVLQDLGSSVSVAYNGLRQQTAIDSAPTTAVVSVGSQFGLAVNFGLDGVVDVENSRQQFLAQTTPAGLPASAAGGDTRDSGASDRGIDQDTFGFTVSSGAELLAVTPTAADVAVSGADLDFLLDEDGEFVPARVDVFVNGTAQTTTDALDEDTGAVDIAIGANISNVLTEVTLETDGEAVLEAPQSFSANFSVDYNLGGTTGTTDFGSAGVGAWGLSGATVNIPFMPYGPNVGQVIQVSNSGAVEGDIELTAFDNEGNQFGPVALSVSAAANSVTNIQAAVNQALLAEGFDGSGGVDITLVINSPAEDIDVVANYRVAGDRVAVPVQ